MVHTLDLYRKRLLYQSQHRGMRESDLLIGGFAKRHISEMTKEQLQRYEKILGVNDTLFLEWIYGRTPVPKEHTCDVFDMIRHYAENQFKRQRG